MILESSRLVASFWAFFATSLDAPQQQGKQSSKLRSPEGPMHPHKILSPKPPKSHSILSRETLAMKPRSPRAPEPKDLKRPYTPEISRIRWENSATVATVCSTLFGAE